MEVAAIIIGGLITIVLSVFASWITMNARMFEVEAKIKLIDATKSDNKEIGTIKEALIRIEGKLDLKQNRFK